MASKFLWPSQNIWTLQQKHNCLPHRPEFSGFFDLCLHWVYLIFIHKHFTRFQNQSFWSGSQVVLHLLLSRSWMLFALEKLAAAAALDLALPSHNTMGSKYSWIRICDFKFLWFHEKNASDLSKAESLRNNIELRIHECFHQIFFLIL